MRIDTEPLWLPGFFTGRTHAVVDLADRTDFRGVKLAWSVCNRPVVLDPDPTAEPTDDPVCPACATWFDTRARYQ
ncbi:MAG: hypothetical protein WBA97_39960 [Actinophytocola sp.]|uniref:hypothetical protein n=1 Tax=Actinophytocola sp. TaxID=1872138 RepID=UPI003C784801